jgi:hypothetical protein
MANWFPLPELIPGLKNQFATLDCFLCEEWLFELGVPYAPFISRLPPIHLRCQQCRIDAILIPQGDIDEGINERVGE